MIDGQPTYHLLRGAYLEAAVWTPIGYVIFLTDDVPAEDQLTVHLLSHQGVLLDSATLGNAYTTGSFGQLKLLQPEKLQFRFIGEVDWLLTILPGKRLRFPFGSEATGVSRPFGITRWFTFTSLQPPLTGN